MRTKWSVWLVALVLATVATLSAPPASGDFGYQPLWPFASEAEADQWSQDGGLAGESPWHADPAATALRFTRDYLGFTEVDRTTAVTERGDEAWVGVGYDADGHLLTVATIHLARIGATADAPWEVVGTEDEWFTLESPTYGSTVGPVIEAGGRITGVDECIRLMVRQSTQQAVLGDFSCQMAGGDDAPWAAVVSATGAQPGVVTLVAVTGGHVAEVEKFAVTGLVVG